MQEVGIVTGAASGIGRAIAEALVERGMHVTLADVDGERVTAASEQLAAAGGRVDGTVLDVSDAEAFSALVGSVHDSHGRLDYLFNNAGIAVGGEPEELQIEHWNRAIDVNLRGAVNGCHAAYPIMVDQGFGHIVNTASLAGLIGGTAMAAPYAMTKYGVVGLSLALHVAGVDHGVGVHVVCPGGIDTPLIDQDGAPGLPTVPSQRGATMRNVLKESGIPLRLYPPEKLATDVLRGVEKGRPLIVAPASARFAWRMFRLMPGPMLRGSIAGTRRWRTRRPAAAASEAA